MMKNFGNPTIDQRGVASLLTVVFFILISSVITVGFMRMALLEGRQSLEDSLSKAALAAAYSGVNDAKRALLYCSQFAARPSACANLNDITCPGFSGNLDIQSVLGLDFDNNTGSIRVGERDLNERYTCVIVTEDTYTVEGSLIPGSSEDETTLFPLRSTDPAFDAVTISWHQKSPARTAALGSLTYGDATDMFNSSYRDPDAIDPESYEADPDWPALVNAHLMTQTGNIDYSSTDGSVTGIDQKRWWLFPYGGAAGGVDQTAVGSAPRQLVRCNSSGIPLKTDDGRRYHCQMTITGLNTIAGVKYLQLTGLYNESDYVVEISRGATPVTFDNVSPRIDSTGAVEDVFRRVQVSLRYEGKGFGGRNPILPNAIDTGEGLCKNFSVGSVPDNFSEDCGPSSSVLGAGDTFNAAVAELGGFCAVNDCPPDSPGDDGSDGALGPPTNFTQNIFNISNNPDADVAGCTWTISDGTVIQNQYCLEGDKFVHTFPTTPYPPKTKYQVNLRVVLKNGSTAAYTGEFWMPRR